MVDHSIHGLQYVEQLSYLGTFFAVALSGYAIPIPEELILVLAGYLAGSGLTNIGIVVFVCVLGAIFGDSLIYLLSSRGSSFTEKYVRKIEGTRLGWYTRAMKHNTERTIYISRFIVGMRFLNPLVSGLMEVPFKKFIKPTAASALTYIPIIILLGYYFHDQIHLLVRIMHSVRVFIITGLVIASIIFIVGFFTQLIKKKR